MSSAATTSAPIRMTFHSAKNILYTVVNSRAYEAENLNPGMAKWKIIMIGADVVVALLIVGLEYTAIKNYKKRKEEEEEV
jgi:beta-glucosidase